MPIHFQYSPLAQRPPLPITPKAEAPAQHSDESGYEWYTKEDGTNYYRIASIGADWIKFEN